MLLTFAADERLAGAGRLVDLLGEPAGVEDIAFEVPVSRELPRPAAFE